MQAVAVIYGLCDLRLPAQSYTNPHDPPAGLPLALGRRPCAFLPVGALALPGSVPHLLRGTHYSHPSPWAGMEAFSFLNLNQVMYSVPRERHMKDYILLRKFPQGHLGAPTLPSGGAAPGSLLGPTPLCHAQSSPGSACKVA